MDHVAADADHGQPGLVALAGDGAEALAEHVKAHLGVDFGQTSADGRVTLDPVYCLGNCALSPALMIDGRLYGRMRPERFDALARTELDVP